MTLPPKIKITILGFTVPDEVLCASGVSPTVAPQTRNFAEAMQVALQDGGAEVSLISTLPILNYPHTRSLVCRSKRFTMNGSAGQSLGFVNLVGLKHLTRFTSCIGKGRKRIDQIGPNIVVIHGVHSPLLWFALFLKATRGIKIITVLTDPPGRILPSDNVLVRLLKRLDARLIQKTLSQMHGIVALTDQLAESFAPKIPHLTMEGILNPRLAVDGPLPSKSDSPFVITYAGGLSEEYGVRALVEAVQLIESSNVRLELCGSGDLESWLASVQLHDPRVQFLGTLEFTDVRSVLVSSNLLVNPRPLDQHFVQYSFPSKLIEYMSTSRPVLSTRLPGVPAEYFDHLWVAESADPVVLADAIREVIATAPELREQRGLLARDFVIAKTGTHSQGSLMIRFMQDLPS